MATAATRGRLSSAPIGAPLATRGNDEPDKRPGPGLSRPPEPRALADGPRARARGVRRRGDSLGPPRAALPRRPRSAVQDEPPLPALGAAARRTRLLHPVRAWSPARAGVPPAARLLAQAADLARGGLDAGV